jgi:hypothetical protein
MSGTWSENYLDISLLSKYNSLGQIIAAIKKFSPLFSQHAVSIKNTNTYGEGKKLIFEFELIHCHKTRPFYDPLLVKPISLLPIDHPFFVSYTSERTS